MNREAGPERAERIVVALDASPQSVAALRAAAELAALMEAEVEGLFIEDINLLYLCDLPFGREVGSYTARVRRLETSEMERHLRVLAATIREAMRRVASQTPMRWSFSVRRGVVSEELLAAAESASLVSVGRGGRAPRAGIGSTAQSLVEQVRRPLLISSEGSSLEYPLTLLYTGTAAARRALELALRLVRRESSRLRIVVWGAGDTSADLGELEQAVRRLAQPHLEAGAEPLIVVKIPASADLLTTLAGLAGGTLVLPHEQASLVAAYGRPSLLVP